MTGKTHKVYSVCFAFITAMVFYRLGVTEINYYLALIIILWASKAGAIFPDTDQEWKYVPNKNTITHICNKLIHLTGGKHRSWQTHSIDICAYFTTASVIIPKMLYEREIITNVNKEVLSIILLGFASGWISHIFSDMLNGEGVRLLCFSKIKVSLVPRKIGKLKFNTGNEWEAFNYKVITKLNKLLGIVCIIYPLMQ